MNINKIGTEKSYFRSASAKGVVSKRVARPFRPFRAPWFIEKIMAPSFPVKFRLDPLFRTIRLLIMEAFFDYFRRKI